jgi:hypothetical protein
MNSNKMQKLAAAFAAAALAATPASQAQDAPGLNRTTPQQMLQATNAIPPAPAPSRIHELVNLNFANEYVTPRGMILHQQSDQGLTFQPLLLTLINLYQDNGFINSLDFDGGAWADFDSTGVAVNPPYGSRPRTDFVEIDPIAGLSVGFAKYFTLGVTYTAFGMQVLDIGYSQHLETKLSFDDSSFLGPWALHPTLIFWQELAKKATDADLPLTLYKEGFYAVAPRKGATDDSPNSSYYFDAGVAPAYKFQNGIKLEAPCRILLPDERFYGDYYAHSSFVGLWEVGTKCTIPIKFMPEGYGHWNFFLGTKFLYFVDDNLVRLNYFNAPARINTRETIQGFAGVSVFF